MLSMSNPRGPLVLLLALACACGTQQTQRVNIDEDDSIMGTGLESADIEALEAFATGLIQAPALTGPEVDGIPVVAIFPVENNTSQDFDGELLVRRIETELIKLAAGRIRFVRRDKASLDLIEREREAKRAGDYTAKKQEVMPGVDYYLTGKASDIAKVGRGLESRAIWIDFDLLDAETREIVWRDTFKTKKVGEAGILYR